MSDEQAAFNLDAARRALWRRDAQSVRAKVDPVIAAYSSERKEIAVPHRAYRSLALRMESKFSEALADAEYAVLLDPKSIEAIFALSVAQLSLKNIEQALWNYSKLKNAHARDNGAHFLKPLGFVLFIECIMNMEDDGHGMRIDFRVTPATKAAIRLLDGYPELAEKELASQGRRDTVSALALGLAAYRLSGWNRAGSLFQEALDGLADDGFRIGWSIKRLLADVAAEKASC